jgi:hypothetical protein
MAVDERDAFLIAGRTSLSDTYELNARVGKTDGTDEQPFGLGRNGNSPFLRLEGGEAYLVISHEAQGEVVRRKPDGKIEALAESQWTPSGLAVDENRVYWLASDVPGEPSRRSLRSVTRSQPGPPDRTSAPYGQKLDCDELALYWTTDSAVLRMVK